MDLKLTRNFYRPLLLYNILLLIVVALITLNLAQLHMLLNEKENQVLEAKACEVDAHRFNSEFEKYIDRFLVSNDGVFDVSSIIKEVSLNVKDSPLTIKSITNEFNEFDQFEGYSFIHKMITDKAGFMSILIENVQYRSYFKLDKINDVLSVKFLPIEKFLSTQAGKNFINSYGAIGFDVYSPVGYLLLTSDKPGMVLEKVINSPSGFRLHFQVQEDLTPKVNIRILNIIVLACSFVILVIVIIYKLTKVKEVEKNTKKLERDNIRFVKRIAELENTLDDLIDEKESSDYRINKYKDEVIHLKDTLDRKSVRCFESENMASLGKLTMGMILRNYLTLKDMKDNIKNIRRYLLSLNDRYYNRTLNENYFKMLKVSYLEELDSIEFLVNKNIDVIAEQNEIVYDFEERRLRKVEFSRFINAVINSYDIIDRFPNVEIKVESDTDIKINTYPNILAQLMITLINGITQFSIVEHRKGNIWIVLHESNNILFMTILDDGDARVNGEHDNDTLFSKEWSDYLKSVREMVTMHLNGNVTIVNRKLKGIEYNIEFPKSVYNK